MSDLGSGKDATDRGGDQKTDDEDPNSDEPREEVFAVEIENTVEYVGHMEGAEKDDDAAEGTNLLHLSTFVSVSSLDANKGFCVRVIRAVGV